MRNLTGGQVFARRRIVNGEISHANGQNGLRPEEIKSKKSRSEIQSSSDAKNAETWGRQEGRSQSGGCPPSSDCKNRRAISGKKRAARNWRRRKGSRSSGTRAVHVLAFPDHAHVVAH